MAAFTVGRDETGRRIWWVNWQCPGYSAPDMREPTAEEAEIMTRIEWGSDYPGDAELLRALLESA